MPPPFKLTKQIILTSRKLQTGPLDNYMHAATLIHKLNMLLFECETLKDVQHVLRLIFSDQLLTCVIDFITNTDQFANFGIRLLELLAMEYSPQVIKSGTLPVLLGLLRTNDYETIVQSLSFVSTLIKHASKVSDVVSPSLLALIIKVCNKDPQLEYLYFTVDIDN